MMKWIRHWRTLLRFLPAFLVLVVFAGLVTRGLMKSDDINNRYRVAARQAIAEKDLQQAKFYYSRLIGKGDQGTQQDQLNWALALAQSGDQQEAIATLAKLAPDDAAGFRPAHRLQAEILAGAVQSGLRGDVLEKLRHHLKQGASDDSVGSHRLWVIYYLALNQSDDVVLHLSAAAQSEPDLWMDVAAYCKATGRNDASAKALQRVEAHARSSLDDDPLDAPRRVLLARVLVDREQYDEAETLLRGGVALRPEASLSRALSDLMLMKLRALMRSQPEQAKGWVAYLGRAAQYDSNNPDVYRVWSIMYQSLTTPELRNAVRGELESLIVRGESNAFAHLTVGTFYWQEGSQTQATFHMERAFTLDPNMLNAANNLAWVLAVKEQPDLDRAEKLIRSVLERKPADVRYRHTLAEILVRRERWDEALDELEAVLSLAGADLKISTHDLLARTYEKLGQPRLAKLHREQAAELRAQPATAAAN